jgi:dCMP deaminase
MDVCMSLKWDTRYLYLAGHISTWSKDPSTQCGAVITDGHRIISTGFNGFPQGIKDDERLDVRGTKYEIVLHAEQNAILFAKQDLHNCTIYSYPFQPCSRCASMLIQAGISKVVTTRQMPGRWQESFDLATQLFNEANVELIQLGT